MTQTASKVARGVRSYLALLLCVIVLAAAVDSECTTNDTLLPQGILSWTEADAGDDPDGTTYGDAAISEKFCVIPCDNDSDMQTTRPKIHSATVAINFNTRAPPLFDGIGSHALISFEPTRRSLSGRSPCQRLVPAVSRDCVLVRSEAELLLSGCLHIHPLESQTL